MTIEKFYETLLLVIELDKHLGLQTEIEKIKDGLSNIASAPAQPQHQTALASALAALDEATDKLDRLLTPVRFPQLPILAEGSFSTLISQSKYARQYRQTP